MPKKLFVGNLNYHTNDNNLRQAFESYGEITKARVIIDRYGGRSRGFGFVTFVRDEDAKTAISKMNGVKVDGRYIKVEEAQEKSPRKNKRAAEPTNDIMTTENKDVSKGRILFSMVYVLFLSALLLYLSGDWLWIEGWLFGIWLITLSLGTTFYLYRKDPALLAERFRKPGAKGQKRWDKYFLYFFIAAFHAWIAIMPLDAKKYEWNKNFPVGLKVLGGVFLLLSGFFIFRALAENTFASPLVRMQTERRQRVI
jgi:hypothetical protein